MKTTIEQLSEPDFIKEVGTHVAAWCARRAGQLDAIMLSHLMERREALLLKDLVVEMLDDYSTLLGP